MSGTALWTETPISLCASYAVSGPDCANRLVPFYPPLHPVSSSTRITCRVLPQTSKPARTSDSGTRVPELGNECADCTWDHVETSVPHPRT
eukprot:3634537-Rhodomonas_salina.1